MKTFNSALISLVLISLVFITGAPVFGEDITSPATAGINQGMAGAPDLSAESREYQWQDKLKRGAINIVSSPVEIARQIQISSDEKSLAYGWTVGLVQGLGQGIVRLGAGVLDLVTCPFNFPDDKKAPLVKPEYVWQKPGVKYS